MQRLNLGCGRDVREGWVNLDRANLPGVNVVHDLTELPLPFDDGHFELIEAKDVLEHLDYIPLMAELHRILAPNGQLRITVPHFTSVHNFVDPTHIRRFSWRTWEFFCADNQTGRDYYFSFAFEGLESVHISFSHHFRLLEKLVNRGRRWRQAYEATGLCWMFPARNLTVTLRR